MPLHLDLLCIEPIPIDWCGGNLAARRPSTCLRTRLSGPARSALVGWPRPLGDEAAALNLIAGLADVVTDLARDELFPGHRGAVTFDPDPYPDPAPAVVTYRSGSSAIDPARPICVEMGTLAPRSPRGFWKRSSSRVRCASPAISTQGRAIPRPLAMVRARAICQIFPKYDSLRHASS